MLMPACDFGFNVYSTSPRRVWNNSFHGYDDEVFLVVTVQVEIYKTNPGSPLSLVCSGVSRNSEKCLWKLQLTLT